MVVIGTITYVQAEQFLERIVESVCFWSPEISLLLLCLIAPDWSGCSGFPVVEPPDPSVVGKLWL